MQMNELVASTDTLHLSYRYSQFLDGEMPRLHAEAQSARQGSSEGMQGLLGELRHSLRGIDAKFPMESAPDGLDTATEQVWIA